MRRRSVNGGGFTWFPGGHNERSSKSGKSPQRAPASPTDYFTPAEVFAAERDLKDTTAALPPPVDGVHPNPSEAGKYSKLNGAHYPLSGPQPSPPSVVEKQKGRVAWMRTINPASINMNARGQGFQPKAIRTEFKPLKPVNEGNANIINEPPLGEHRISNNVSNSSLKEKSKPLSADMITKKEPPSVADLLQRLEE